jgi:hypothetical protein
MDDARTTAREDTMIEATVLQQLLALHPIQLTLDDLQREIAGEAGRFAPNDAVQRAVRELAAAGLALRNGEVVLPSRAALRFEELLS